jgi:hypothetical protein
LIRPALSGRLPPHRDKDAMSQTPEQPRQRRINWLNVTTVASAATLIAAEVFGGAFAAGWAFATLFQLGEYGAPLLQGAFFVIGLYVMYRFIQAARRIEPFTD